MKCPHCLENFHEVRQASNLQADKDGYWRAVRYMCPACQRWVIFLENYHVFQDEGQRREELKETILVRPKGSIRPPAPREVPEAFAQDYHEACMVLPDSAKASAALSRRCLQNILREKAGAVERDLAKQIQTVLNEGQLPSYLSADLDAVRNIGNFAAHPIKSQHSGEVLPVEPGEAEWNLDVIEALFDFYFVAPARAEARRTALNQKLKDAGKPEMKSTSP
jgi:hypothetical protein